MEYQIQLITLLDESKQTKFTEIQEKLDKLNTNIEDDYPNKIIFGTGEDSLEMVTAILSEKITNIGNNNKEKVTNVFAKLFNMIDLMRPKTEIDESKVDNKIRHSRSDSSLDSSPLDESQGDKVGRSQSLNFPGGKRRKSRRHHKKKAKKTHRKKKAKKTRQKKKRKSRRKRHNTRKRIRH